MSDYTKSYHLNILSPFFCIWETIIESFELGRTLTRSSCLTPPHWTMNKDTDRTRCSVSMQYLFILYFLRYLKLSKKCITDLPLQSTCRASNVIFIHNVWFFFCWGGRGAVILKKELGVTEYFITLQKYQWHWKLISPCYQWKR